MSNDDSGKYFARYVTYNPENDKILERESFEDALNEIATHEGATLISTHVIPNTFPMWIITIWKWD
jgi:hypothetical protein